MTLQNKNKNVICRFKLDIFNQIFQWGLLKGTVHVGGRDSLKVSRRVYDQL